MIDEIKHSLKDSLAMLGITPNIGLLLLFLLGCYVWIEAYLIVTDINKEEVKRK